MLVNIKANPPCDTERISQHLLPKHRHCVTVEPPSTISFERSLTTCFTNARPPIIKKKLEKQQSVTVHKESRRQTKRRTYLIPFLCSIVLQYSVKNVDVT